ncbi:MAG: bifunctional oligoribonuclease/PAP phosphatase NrnA [Bacilli bacterium]|nr:bifunctional oligoribonuclease/PAP phosphatase NrnA [Bacilli bacterium]
MYSALKAFIEKHDTITIFSHIYPDGDALGSVIGLRELIKTNYPHKKVYGLGANIAPFVNIIGETDMVDDETIKQSAALVIDVANGDRVEDQRFKLAKARFKLDHHIFAEKYTDEEIVNNNRIATAEMIGEFILREDLQINALGATALALGIITDSGRFMYDLTSAVTFEVMAMLLSNGASLKDINNNLSIRKIDGLKARGYFQLNYEVYKEVIFIVVPYDKLQELEVLPSQGGMFVNTYSNIEGYHSWATFFIDEEGKVFVELRSKSRNVQKVAVTFGGGGHLKASGCRLNSIDEISKVLEVLNDGEELGL